MRDLRQRISPKGKLQESQIDPFGGETVQMFNLQQSVPPDLQPHLPHAHPQRQEAFRVHHLQQGLLPELRLEKTHAKVARWGAPVRQQLQPLSPSDLPSQHCHRAERKRKRTAHWFRFQAGRSPELVRRTKPSAQRLPPAPVRLLCLRPIHKHFLVLSEFPPKMFKGETLVADLILLIPSFSSFLSFFVDNLSVFFPFCD